MESVVTRMKVDDSGGGSKNEELVLNNLYLDPIGFQVKMGQKEIDLTVKEFNLLYLFAHHVGRWLNDPKSFRLFQLQI
jgi:DNA-binding response OmpR family regulator